MPSIKVNLDTNFKPLISFIDLKVQYFNIEIQNFEGTALEFAFGNPANGAPIVIRVPNKSATSREAIALVGTLYGRCVSGIANPTIEYW